MGGSTATAMLDTTTKAGGRAAERLEREIIAWLTTVTPAGQAQSSPVWFLWAGGEFLVYSLAVTPRIRNLAANTRVSVHLNSDAVGGDIVTMEGEALVDLAAPPAAAVPAYLEKYRHLIAESGWTPEKFSQDYPLPIRIRPTRIRLG
jgi:PPOX class probable F420-dependent enzyme